LWGGIPVVVKVEFLAWVVADHLWGTVRALVCDA
jgi:hypothetical protein